MRRAGRRDTVEAEIVDVLQRGGCSVERLSAPHVPDLLIGRRGITALAEVKTAARRLQPGQVAWALAWRGSPPFVLRTVGDALALLDAL